MNLIDWIFSFIQVILRTSTPILYAALGVLLMQRAGIINMAAEGLMLIGALSGVVGSMLTGNVWLGAVFAMLVTGCVGLVFGYFTISLQSNQVVTGIAFNILGVGLTTTLSRVIFGTNKNLPKIDTFDPVLFGQPLPVFLGILLVFAIYIFIYKTKFGLKLRAVGENPLAVETVGISVYKVRYTAVFLGAMLSGMGGAYLSLGILSFFTENMVVGRGYISMAAVIFGGYTPIGTWLAVLVFGAGEALQYKLQAINSGISSEFILMIPYILTIIALMGFVRNSAEPKALGIPYKRK